LEHEYESHVKIFYDSNFSSASKAYFPTNYIKWNYLSEQTEKILVAKNPHTIPA